MNEFEFDLEEIESRLYSQVHYGNGENSVNILTEIPTNEDMPPRKRRPLRYFKQTQKNQPNGQSSFVREVHSKSGQQQVINEINTIRKPYSSITIREPEQINNYFEGSYVSQINNFVVLPNNLSHNSSNSKSLNRKGRNKIKRFASNLRKKFLKENNSANSSGVKKEPTVTEKQAALNQHVIYLSDTDEDDCVEIPKVYPLLCISDSDDENQSKTTDLKKDNQEEKDDDVLIIENSSVDIIDVDELDRSNSPLLENEAIPEATDRTENENAQQMKAIIAERKDLATPDSLHSNDFLDASTIRTSSNFNFDLHGVDFKNGESLKPSVCDVSETASSASTNDLNSSMIKTMVFNEVEFPRSKKEILFENMDLENFGNSITPQRGSKELSEIISASSKSSFDIPNNSVTEDSYIFSSKSKTLKNHPKSKSKNNKSQKIPALSSIDQILEADSKSKKKPKQDEGQTEDSTLFLAKSKRKKNIFNEDDKIVSEITKKIRKKKRLRELIAEEIELKKKNKKKKQDKIEAYENFKRSLEEITKDGEIKTKKSKNKIYNSESNIDFVFSTPKKKRKSDTMSENSVLESSTKKKSKKQSSQVEEDSFLSVQDMVEEDEVTREIVEVQRKKDKSRKKKKMSKLGESLIDQSLADNYADTKIALQNKEENVASLAIVSTDNIENSDVFGENIESSVAEKNIEDIGLLHEIETNKDRVNEVVVSPPSLLTEVAENYHNFNIDLIKIKDDDAPDEANTQKQTHCLDTTTPFEAIESETIDRSEIENSEIASQDDQSLGITTFLQTIGLKEVDIYLEPCSQASDEFQTQGIPPHEEMKNLNFDSTSNEIETKCELRIQEVFAGCEIESVRELCAEKQDFDDDVTEVMEDVLRWVCETEEKRMMYMIPTNLSDPSDIMYVKDLLPPDEIKIDTSTSTDLDLCIVSVSTIQDLDIDDGPNIVNELRSENNVNLDVNVPNSSTIEELDIADNQNFADKCDENENDGIQLGTDENELLNDSLDDSSDCVLILPEPITIEVSDDDDVETNQSAIENRFFKMENVLKPEVVNVVLGSTIGTIRVIAEATERDVPSLPASSKNVGLSLSNSDVRTIQSTMSNNAKLWQICDIDQFHVIVPVLKCGRCRRNGHTSLQCPSINKMPICSLCAGAGHTTHRCPEKLCIECGRPTKFEKCRPCIGNRKQLCTLCQMRGHSKNYCPDIWRRYHVTTEEGPIVVPDGPRQKSKKELWCSGCARSGHLEYECPLFYLTRECSPLHPFIVEYQNVYPSITNNSAGIDPNESLDRTIEKSLETVDLRNILNQRHVEQEILIPSTSVDQNKRKPKRTGDYQLDTLQLGTVDEIKAVLKRELKHLDEKKLSPATFLNRYSFTRINLKSFNKQLNMLVFGKGKFKGGEIHLKRLSQFLDKKTKDITNSERQSLFNSYDFIFSKKRRKFVDYLSFLKILTKRHGNCKI